MKKRLSILLCLFALTLAAWCPATAIAQNKIFEKYGEMEHVKYVCITQSMLGLLGKSSATINGVRIEGITDAIHVIVIASASHEQVRQQMKADFQTLKGNPTYKTLMEARNDGERVSTLINDTDSIREIVMYIVSPNGEQTFIVLTGTFTDDQLQKLLSGKKK